MCRCAHCGKIYPHTETMAYVQVANEVLGLICPGCIPDATKLCAESLPYRSLVLVDEKDVER